LGHIIAEAPILKSSPGELRNPKLNRHALRWRPEK
jgi:hypothetical protein